MCVLKSRWKTNHLDVFYQIQVKPVISEIFQLLLPMKSTETAFSLMTLVVVFPRTLQKKNLIFCVLKDCAAVCTVWGELGTWKPK